MKHKQESWTDSVTARREPAQTELAVLDQEVCTAGLGHLLSSGPHSKPGAGAAPTGDRPPRLQQCGTLAEPASLAPRGPGTPSSSPRPTGVFPTGFSTLPSSYGTCSTVCPLDTSRFSYLSPCRPLSYLVDKPCSELSLLKHLLWVVSD